MKAKFLKDLPMNDYLTHSSMPILSDLSGVAAPATLVAVLLGLLVLVVIRAMKAQVWIWRLKYLVAVGILLVAGQVLLYFTLLDRCETLSRAPDGTAVLLFGRVDEVRAGNSDRDYVEFIIADPTGRTLVQSEDGPPAEGSICFVKGRKGTRRDLPVVECEMRVSTWGLHASDD